MLAFNDSKKMLNPLDNRAVLLYLCRLIYYQTYKRNFNRYGN